MNEQGIKELVAVVKPAAVPTMPAGSLNRAVMLLTAIARGSRKGSLLTELVARTDLPRPTIHRVLDTLIEVGWVQRDEQSSRFLLGRDLAGMGYSAISHHPIERVAHTELSALAERLRQTVYINIRSGLDTVCIGRHDSQSQIQIGKGHAGLRMPFGVSQNCLAMFSHLSQEEVRQVIEINMSRYHRIEGFDENGYHQAVANALTNGYGTFDNIILDRTTSGFGVAICDMVGYSVAAIGTTYISGWLSEEQQRSCLQQLRDAARNIELSLFA